jgi:hypothetical protein
LKSPTKSILESEVGIQLVDLAKEGLNILGVCVGANHHKFDARYRLEALEPGQVMDFVFAPKDFAKLKIET